MLRATLEEATPLQMQLGTGNESLYVRVKVYDITGALFLTLGLPHISGGLYGSTYTFAIAGFYTAVYQVFEDAGFLTTANFDIEAETIEANSDKTNILRLLGLTHDNVYIDSHEYDAQGNLTAARVRHYNSKTNAGLHGAAGLLDTWTVAATYVLERLNTYKVVREP